MKSIKLKAEEHLRENNITQYEYKSYIEGADFGANYVLKEIEHFAESTWGASSLNTISLKKMIKELKGE